MFLSKPTAGISLGVVWLLSACGGGGVSVLDPGPNGLPYAQGTISTAELLTTYLNFNFNGKAADNVHTPVPGPGTYTNSSSSTGGPQSIGIKVVSNTRIDLTIGGTTVTLTDQGDTLPGGLGGTVFSNTDKSIKALFGRAGDGTSLQSILFGYVSQSPGVPFGAAFSDTFVVSGFETDPTEVAALTDTSATYTGLTFMQTRETAGNLITEKSVIANSSGLSLTVNFLTDTVTGTLSGTGDYGATTLTLNPATISGNAFQGTFTGTNADGVGFSNTQINGTFFGQDAAEVGGTFSSELSGGTLPETTYGSGFFTGAK